jgi:hypothetical protein
MFEIDLEWPAASQHVLRSARWGPSRDIAICPAEDATVILRRPLEQNTSLYAEFAKLDGSDQSCLRFAEKYGLLLCDPTQGLDPGKIETLSFWRGNIQVVRDIISRCKLSRANPAEAYRQFRNKDTMVGSVGLYLSIKSPRSPISLEVRQASLLHAIQLQAVQSILGGRSSIQCIECSTWFEIGTGARRSLAKFCSTKCKDSYHNRLKASSKGWPISPQRSSSRASPGKPSMEK